MLPLPRECKGSSLTISGGDLPLTDFLNSMLFGRQEKKAGIMQLQKRGKWMGLLGRGCRLAIPSIG